MIKTQPISSWYLRPNNEQPNRIWLSIIYQNSGRSINWIFWIGLKILLKCWYWTLQNSNIEIHVYEFLYQLSTSFYNGTIGLTIILFWWYSHDRCSNLPSLTIPNYKNFAKWIYRIYRFLIQNIVSVSKFQQLPAQIRTIGNFLRIRK